MELRVSKLSSPSRSSLEKVYNKARRMARTKVEFKSYCPYKEEYITKYSDKPLHNSLQDFVVVNRDGSVILQVDCQCNATLEFCELLQELKDPTVIMSITNRSNMPRGRAYRKKVKAYYDWLVNDSYFSHYILSDKRFSYLKGLAVKGNAPANALGGAFIIHRMAWEYSWYVERWYDLYKAGATGEEALLLTNLCVQGTSRPNSWLVGRPCTSHKIFWKLSEEGAWNFWNKQHVNPEDSLFPGGSVGNNALLFGEVHKGATITELFQLEASNVKPIKVFKRNNIFGDLVTNEYYSSEQVIDILRKVLKNAGEKYA